MEYQDAFQLCEVLKKLFFYAFMNFIPWLGDFVNENKESVVSASPSSREQQMTNMAFEQETEK